MNATKCGIFTQQIQISGLWHKFISLKRLRHSESTLIFRDIFVSLLITVNYQLFSFRKMVWTFLLIKNTNLKLSINSFPSDPTRMNAIWKPAHFIFIDLVSLSKCDDIYSKIAFLSQKRIDKTRFCVISKIHSPITGFSVNLSYH